MALLREIHQELLRGGIDLASEVNANMRAELERFQDSAVHLTTDLARARLDLRAAEASLAREPNATDERKAVLRQAVEDAQQSVDDILAQVGPLLEQLETVRDDIPNILAAHAEADARREAEGRRQAEEAQRAARAARQRGTGIAAEIRAAVGASATELADELVAVLEENLNGSPLASDAEVAAGYIPTEHYFHYFADTAASIPLAEGPDGDRVLAARDGERLDVSFIRNLALNCHMLRKGKRLSDEMFLTCFIKTLIAYSGVFQPDTTARCVFIDEYMVHYEVPAGFTATLREMALIKRKEEIAEVEAAIKRNVHRIIGTAVHVFRTRNHHWTDSSQEFVARTWSAAWNGEPPEWRISEEALFRSSLHCFGMRPLVDYTERANRLDILPVALKIRRTAARAGTAPVRLVAAAFACMRAEPFYPEVRAAFGDQIDAVNTHVEELKAAGDSAHVNHWFMCGVTPRANYREDLAEPLMPIAVAYIQSLGPQATLKSQQALRKRIANHVALVNALTEKFTSYRTDVFGRSTLVELLRNYRAAATADATTVPTAAGPAASTTGAPAGATA